MDVQETELQVVNKQCCSGGNCMAGNVEWVWQNAKKEGADTAKV